MVTSGPIEVVLKIFQAVWQVLVVGSARAGGKIFWWLFDGTWFVVTMKLGVAFMTLVLIRSMWARLSDVGDRSPMVPVIVVALMIGAAIAGLVAHATGLWLGLSMRW